MLDIIRAAQLALVFTQGQDRETFLQDLKTQSAVLHQLMVMGEAVKRLSLEYREEHPDIPWKLMAGMRDVLIHGYDIVNLKEVWKTINVDVPQVLPLLEALAPRD
ncbi:MAG TPA: DUF86 domain-containing protein [Anaerolineae bacterium]|nr:DUF86 domain-containing protein [Anaerolineae bacterium]